jgi:hypothetical protein
MALGKSGIYNLAEKIFFSYNDRVRIKKRISNTKKFFLAGIFIICAIAILIFISSEKSIPHHNLIDTKISTYSDQHITPNAMRTNPEFKNIVFDVTVPAGQSFFSNQIAAVIKSVKSLITTLPTEKEKGAKEYGSWIWTPIMSMSSEYMESILTDAKADGVNVMYVSIDTYLDIFTMDKGDDRENKKKAFGDKLEDFITRANRKGIKVDAEAGWRNWAEDDNVYKAFAVVNYVRNFNTTHENKFRGFQYDVEPYLLNSYDKNKTAVLKNFIGLVDKTEYFIGTSTLQFSVVVPDFYDKKDGLTPKISYNGKDDFTFDHLLNILDRRSASSIIIMSYRNIAIGDDGTIEISNNEMQTANSNGHSTKIIIAQETGDVPPPYITFHNTSKKYLERQIDNISTAFETYPNFGGIAVHYVNAFLALK